MSGDPHSEDAFERLRYRLDEAYDWPAMFVFKAIVPQARLQDVVLHLAPRSYRTRESRNGRYVSVTCEFLAGSADEILVLYRVIGSIEGAITL